MNGLRPLQWPMLAGGTVTNTEIGDDGEAYEVDIRRDDGTQVEAELDSNLNVTGTEADDADEGADGEEVRGDDEGSEDDYLVAREPLRSPPMRRREN